MRKGFTLVELSIVLVIIGLLVGGILVARSMASTSKVQRVVLDLQQYNAAFNSFKSTYKYLPGDLPTTFNIIGTACMTGGGAQPNQINGNGDGIIQVASSFEGSLAFCEAWTLGFIDRKTSTAPYTMPAPYKNAVYWVEDYNRCGFAPRDSCFVITNFSQGDERSDTITPAEAVAIDGKMDDGKIATGFVKGQEAAFGPNNNQCGNWIGKYNLAYTNPACWMTIKLHDNGNY